MSHRKFFTLLALIIVGGSMFRWWSGRIPDLPAAELVRQGDALVLEGKYDEALRILSAALEKDPLDPHALTSRAECYAKTLKGEQALNDLDAAIRISNGRYRDAFLLRAYIYSVAGEFDRALADANRAVELDDKQADGYVMRAVVYRDPKKGNLSLARKDFEKAETIAPGVKQQFSALAN